MTLRLLIVGLWNDLFTFDNRFWHSFVILLAKPGELTRRYMNGKRVRYIPPVRMYLFVSIIFFFILSNVASNNENFVVLDDDDETELAGAGLDSLATLSVQDDQNGQKDTINGVLFGDQFEVKKDSFVSTIFSLAPKGMFLMLPIFAALLAIIYRRSHRLYVEHLIFSLHFHTLTFILFTIGLLITVDWFQLGLLVAFNLYLYLSMKRVYQQGWLKTWLKHFLLTGAYNFVLVIFLSAVLAGGIMLTLGASQYPRWLGWVG